MRRHVLPQVLPANLVVWSFTVGALVVIEGALSFLGLGVKPPTPSWGNILSDGTAYLETAWWICRLAGADDRRDRHVRERRSAPALRRRWRRDPAPSSVLDAGKEVAP